MPGFHFDSGDMERHLEDLQKKVEKASEPHTVELRTLFSPEFMKRYSEVSSIGELFEKPEGVEPTLEEFEALSVAELDAAVRARTRFDSWDEMKNKAAEEHMRRRLGF